MAHLQERRHDCTGTLYGVLLFLLQAEEKNTKDGMKLLNSNREAVNYIISGPTLEVTLPRSMMGWGLGRPGEPEAHSVQLVSAITQ
jgi:hypothetical protein